MVACGTSGLLGGRLVEGAPFKSLMSAIPVVYCGFFEADDVDCVVATFLVAGFFALMFLYSLKINYKIPLTKFTSNLRFAFTKENKKKITTE